MAKRTDEERLRNALAARLRELDGHRLKQLEKKDITWLAKREREEIVEQTLASLPKGVYCKLAGRQHAVVDKMARHYRLESLLGDSVDLYDAILDLHDLIAENARLMQPLRRGIEDDDSNVGDLEEGEDVYRLQIKKLEETVRKLTIANERAQIGLKKDRGDAIDRSEVKTLFEVLTTRLQGLGQQLRRSKGGPEAQQSLNEFLDHLAAEIREGDLRL